MSRRAACQVLLLAAACATCARAAQVPFSQADVPLSPRDRLFLSDQTSGTVSVIDPSANKLLGAIQLGGASLADSLSAVFRGQSLVHGMGASPDHRTLAIVCVGSNALVFIDTATNKVKHTTYVGRAPHEAMWTPDGREVWVAVRGESHIAVLDGASYEPLRHVEVPAGPGMTIFSPDGRYAFICSSFTPETVVVDTRSYQVVKRIKQASVFCPNIAASPDGRQVWMTLKDSGRVQVFSAAPPFAPLALLATGPITNHVNFASTPKGQFAYVTVGGARQVKVFTTADSPKLVATIATGDNPHGLWPSGDGSRLYVGLQLGNAVDVIDTASNRVVSRVDVGGQAPMALMYVPQALPAGAAPAANLEAADAARRGAAAHHIELVASGGGKQGIVSSFTLNRQGLIDSLEGAVTGLEPGRQYVLAVTGRRDGSGGLEPVAAFKGGPDGAASTATLGPFRDMLGLGGGAPKKQAQARFLVVAPVLGEGRYGPAVQVQQPQAL